MATGGLVGDAGKQKGGFPLLPWLQQSISLKTLRVPRIRPSPPPPDTGTR